MQIAYETRVLKIYYVNEIWVYENLHLILQEMSSMTSLFIKILFAKKTGLQSFSNKDLYIQKI